MRDIGIGVIGCGFVGRGAQVPAFSSIDGARLIAIADADTNRLSKRPAENGESKSGLGSTNPVSWVILVRPRSLLHGELAQGRIDHGNGREYVPRILNRSVQHEVGSDSNGRRRGSGDARFFRVVTHLGLEATPHGNRVMHAGSGW